jgi:hypothetical protein
LVIIRKIIGMNIHYDGFSFEDESIAGIFSFSLYAPFNEPDKLDKYLVKSNPEPGLIELDELKYDLIGAKRSVTFIYGITSYACLLQYPEWKNWKILVHTDIRTLELNPRTFDIFRSLGVIIGIIGDDTIGRGIHPDRVSDAIIRATRYYPLFHTNKPVLVRDADTIFDNLISNLVTSYVKIEYPEFSTITNAKAQPDQPFPKLLSKWEAYCLEQIQNVSIVQGTTFFIGIDGGYVFESYNYNKIVNLPEIPNPKNILYKDDNGWRTRGLAGIVCSLEPLPMNALTLFPRFVESMLGSGLPPDKAFMIDELYLSYVLYRFMKVEKKLGFIVIRYVGTSNIDICKQVRRPGFKEHDPILYAKFSQEGYDCGQSISSRVEELLRPYQELFYLKYPELHLPDQAFYNPLKNEAFAHIVPSGSKNGKHIPAHPHYNTYKNKNLVFGFPVYHTFRKKKNARRGRSCRRSRRY